VGARHEPLLESLPPVLHGNTRLLILGSFPGVASLRAQQYYAHPRNQFWAIMGRLLGQALPEAPYPERIACLRQHRIGLWDIYASCIRPGSLDTSIRDATPNDLERIIDLAPALRLVVHNGAESARRMAEVEALGIPALRLPSTSPANARINLEAKLEHWRAALAEAEVLPPSA
jgi:hypoxanthine-DNA glycosylase